MMRGPMRSTQGNGEMDSFSSQGPGNGPQDGSIPGLNQSDQAPPDIFTAVDSDSDKTISETEFSTLAQAILEVSGSEVTTSFAEFDSDENNLLDVKELGDVLASAGFAPPRPPDREESGTEINLDESMPDPSETHDMMIQLLGILAPDQGDLGIVG